MTDQGPFMAGNMPKPANRSANKPVYLLKAEDPTVKEKVVLYKVSSIDRFGDYISIKGIELSKAQVKQVKENAHVSIAGREINIEIPWHRVISIENLTYKLAQTGETK
jgi:S-adenosylmethionine hydrolase